MIYKLAKKRMSQTINLSTPLQRSSLQQTQTMVSNGGSGSWNGPSGLISGFAVWYDVQGFRSLIQTLQASVNRLKRFSMNDVSWYPMQNSVLSIIALNFCFLLDCLFPLIHNTGLEKGHQYMIFFFCFTCVIKFSEVQNIWKIIRASNVLPVSCLL